MVETVTLTIETPNGDADELTVPADLLDLLAEGDQSRPSVIGDVALFGLAQRIHGAVHHAEDEPDEHLQDVEGETLDQFEERFGTTFGEATGHSH